MIWKQIKWKGIPFTVSDTGRVKYRYYGHRLRSLKQHDSNGYNVVCAGARTISVHHLVCKAFKSNYTYSCIPNHLDCNKKNNRASNLRCGTQADNVRHAVKNGLIQKGRALWKDVTKSCYPKKPQQRKAS